MNAPIRLAYGEAADPSFIRDLCMTLDHRWVPRRPFMLFTGFIDESDTHGPAPQMVMSAFLGTGREWELFNRGLRRIQRDYGFKIFHGTDFKSRSGEFAGWAPGKYTRLISDLTALVRDELTEGPCRRSRRQCAGRWPDRHWRGSQRQFPDGWASPA